MTALDFRKRLCAITVPAYIVLIAALTISLPYRPLVALDPPFLGLALSLMFRFGASMIVTYLFARGFLVSGSLSLLLLGTGVLIFGISGLSGSVATYLISGRSNDLVTISNTGALAASILFLTGASLVLKKNFPDLLRIRAVLAVAYFGAATFVILLAISSLNGLIPTFLQTGVGATWLNYAVTGMTTSLFAVSSIILIRAYAESKTSILFWFSLGLAFAAISQSAFFISATPGSTVSWLGRSATCLGTIYFLFAILASFKGSSTKGV
jgi:hypothetical protein